MIWDGLAATNAGDQSAIPSKPSAIIRSVKSRSTVVSRTHAVANMDAMKKVRAQIITVRHISTITRAPTSIQSKKTDDRTEQDP